MHKICCNTTQNTRNQRVAQLSFKYYVHRPNYSIQQIAQRATCKFNSNVGQNIPRAFTHLTRIETASPLSDSCSYNVCGPALPTPELADVSNHRYSLCVSGTPSLAWYTRKNSQQD